MKMKKIVSVTAALAITMSAFAGLTLSAQASAYASPYTMLDTEEIKTVYIGKINADQNGVDVEDFEGSVPSSEFASPLTVSDSGVSATDTAKNIYGSGKGLQIPVKANSRNEYPFKYEVTSGKIILRGDIIDSQRNEYVEIYGQNEAGEQITVFKINTANQAANDYISAQVGSTNDTSKRIWVHTRGAGLTLNYAIIDLNAKTVSYSFDAIQWQKGADGQGTTYDTPGQLYTSTNSDVEIGDDLVSVTGIATGIITAGGTKPVFDNVALYSVGTIAGAHDYTINAVDETGNIIKQIASGAAKEGAYYSVDGLNEVLEKDSKYYRIDPDVTNHTVSYLMGSEDATQTVTYTKDESIIAFTEGEDEANVKAVGGSSSQRGTENNPIFSGGQCVNHMGSDSENAGRYLSYEFNVPEKAQYTISGEVFKRTAGKNNTERPYSIYLDIAGDPNGTSNVGVGETPTDNALVPFSFETTLEKGTHKLIYSSYPNNASANLDYILVKKTGDLAAVEFTSKAEFLAKADEEGVLTGTLRFLSSPKISDAKITKYGFKLVTTNNVLAITDALPDRSDDKGLFESGDTFYYDIIDIPNTTDTGDIIGSDIYAVPYVVLDNGQSGYGKPFGAFDSFEWKADELQTSSN